MNGPKVKQPVKLKRVFPIDGLHGTAPLAVELVQHLFRGRAARFEDALQRFEVAALVAAELIDMATPPQAGERTVQFSSYDRASQGQRSLSSSTGKDLEKVVLIPTTTVASHRDALAIAMLLQQ